MILLTGGAGFIGSHFAESLLAQGKQVVILDNFNAFYDPEIKRTNIAEIRRNLSETGQAQEKLVVINGDIRDASLLNELASQYKFDLVVHLAAMAGVRPSIANPVLYYSVNIDGTLNLLEMCKKHGIKKFVFASSSSVYGNNEKVPFSEDDNVDFPISPYAATKKSAELLCHTYHKLYEIDMACLRFFTVYGPRQRPDLAIHKFARLILEDKSIPFYGDGSTQRDYTYIDDIIDGVNKAISWVQSDRGRFDVFNLGESNTISLSRMVSTLENALGKKAQINPLPMQPGDVNRTFADTSKSKRILGYNPHTEFNEGIQLFIKWLKEKETKR